MVSTGRRSNQVGSVVHRLLVFVLTRQSNMFNALIVSSCTVSRSGPRTSCPAGPVARKPDTGGSNTAPLRLDIVRGVPSTPRLVPERVALG